MKKALFITFEGGEGSGKSTQIEYLREYLAGKGMRVAVFREPGSTAVSERIRDILLHTDRDICPQAELFLYCAARAQLVNETLESALVENDAVICDRYSDSTRVYQGYALGLGMDAIEDIVRFAQQGLEPDITFFLDIAPEVGLTRLPGAKDRIEQRALEFHRKVHEGYRQLALKWPKRIKVIPEGLRETTRDAIRGHIDALAGSL
jgi:dTMP kinase